MKRKPRPEWLAFGDRAVRLVLADKPSMSVSRQLAAQAQIVNQHPDVLDVAIGFLEVVAYLAEGCDPAEFIARNPSQGFFCDIERYDQNATGAHHRIPVLYNGEDLAFVAAASRLSQAEVIERHSSARYTVAMLGFQPHFPYLLGLDSGLSLPRRAEPRKSVKAGAVAIAQDQAGIYPCDTPGGWHILGYCAPACCLLLKPGDTIEFLVSSTLL